MIEANMGKVSLKGKPEVILAEFSSIVIGLYREIKIDKELITRCVELGFLSDEEITQERIKTENNFKQRTEAEKRFIENMLKDLFGANENE